MNERLRVNHASGTRVEIATPSVRGAPSAADTVETLLERTSTNTGTVTLAVSSRRGRERYVVSVTRPPREKPYVVVLTRDELAAIALAFADHLPSG